MKAVLTAKLGDKNAEVGSEFKTPIRKDTLLFPVPMLYGDRGTPLYATLACVHCLLTPVADKDDTRDQIFFL